jgi:hypothetical protein
LYLLESGDYADIKLKVRKEQAEGDNNAGHSDDSETKEDEFVFYEAHRLILTSRIQYFEQLLCGKFIESQQTTIDLSEMLSESAL